MKRNKYFVANEINIFYYIFWYTVISLTIISPGIAQVQLNVNEGACKFYLSFELKLFSANISYQLSLQHYFCCFFRNLVESYSSSVNTQ